MLSDKYAGQASNLSYQLFRALLFGLQSDGYIGDGDADLLTHHILLVLRAWDNPAFQTIEDRVVAWFSALGNIDPRDTKEKNFNAFKLYAFVHCKREDVRSYVEEKVKVFCKYHYRPKGFIVLQLGFSLSGDVQEVFPTLMGADLLLTEGSDESITIAKSSIAWAFEQIECNSVYENLSSILGFAMMVGAKYGDITHDYCFQQAVDRYIDRLVATQSDGLWENSRYQSAYIFYDIAKVLAYKKEPRLHNCLDQFLNKMLDEQFFQAPEVIGQNAIIIFSSLLRGFSLLLSKDQRSQVVSALLHDVFQESSLFRQQKAELEFHLHQKQKFEEDLRSKQLMLINPVFFQERTFIKEEKQIFVLMPFGLKTWVRKDPKLVEQLRSEEFDFDSLFRNNIKPAIESMGLSCLRADMIYEPQPFMEKIWREINESAIILADLTSMNPNVLYELGVAITIGKPIIIITQNKEYVPTDLQSYEFIQYKANVGDAEEFGNKLKKAIKSTLEINL
jgi:hypothetical protein